VQTNRSSKKYLIRAEKEKQQPLMCTTDRTSRAKSFCCAEHKQSHKLSTSEGYSDTSVNWDKNKATS
jgi:hypothetical protein